LTTDEYFGEEVFETAVPKKTKILDYTEVERIIPLTFFSLFLQ
jgi:hypothetical protein